MLPSRIPDFLFRQVREAEERADRVYEVVIGIVTDNHDPLKLGRIKVKFPTLPGSDQDTSWWAPMAAFGGGKDRGWWFLPELEDEVLVVFECGDIRKPVILGALWNGVDKPPETNAGSNPRRLIVSRDKSKIIFDDDEGTITLEDGEGIGKIVISKENKISIEAMQGDVCVQAPQGKITIVANEIDIAGQEEVKLTPGSDAKLGTDAGGTLKGGTMVQAQSSKVEVNPGGVQAPQAATLTAEEVQDPLTERIAQVEPGAPAEPEEQAGGGGAGAGGGGAGGGNGAGGGGAGGAGDGAGGAAGADADGGGDPDAVPAESVVPK